MKATQRDWQQVADKARSRLRVHFFCGPDEAGASAAITALIAAREDAGERVEMSGQEVKSDPVCLVDEARSTSLFGDARHLLLRVNGEEALDALKTFTQFADRGEADDAWPIFIVASGATDKSRTAKLLVKRADSLVAMFYPPDLRTMTADVRSMADREGLRLGGNLAERIAIASGLDVRLARSEVAKLALYLDAGTQTPKQADPADYEAIGAATEEDGLMPIVNAALSGEVRRLPAELRRIRELGLNAVGITLALERRAAQLAMLSARLQPGEDVQAFLRKSGVFWKDHRDIIDQLGRWQGVRLERLLSRLTRLHQALLGSSQTADLILARELGQIARYADTRR